MIDSQTQERILVTASGVTYPYLWAPVAQLPEIRKRFDENGIPYWVDTHSISLNGKPPVVVVNLRRAADPRRAQAILDESD